MFEKTHWKQCPLCQKRIREEKLADEEDLQGYFMRRMSKYVQTKGREVMGWDELTQSQIPDDGYIGREAWVKFVKSSGKGASLCNDSCSCHVSYPLSRSLSV